MPQFVLNTTDAGADRAAEIAGQWHSVMTWNDPGVAMYSVTSTGRVHSADHRKNLLAYIDSECLPHAETDADRADLQWLRAWVKAFPLGPSVAERFTKLHPFYRGYIECAFFDGVERHESDPDYSDSDPKQDDASIGDLAPDALAELISDCQEYRKAHRNLVRRAIRCKGYDWTRLGHDLWYTRNGHGVGFWCRDELGDLGREMTDTVGWRTPFGAKCLIRGDDGKIHVSVG